MSNHGPDTTDRAALKIALETLTLISGIPDDAHVWDATELAREALEEIGRAHARVNREAKP